MGKDPQFVVTLDGLDPNVFLEKKLQMIHEDSEAENNSNNLIDTTNVTDDHKQDNLVYNENISDSGKITMKKKIVVTVNESNNTKNITKIIINNNDNTKATKLKSKTDELSNNSNSILIERAALIQFENQSETDNKFSQKKRKASPIVFNNNEPSISKVLIKNDGSKEDRPVATNKYDTLPSRKYTKIIFVFFFLRFN